MDGATAHVVLTETLFPITRKCNLYIQQECSIKCSRNYAHTKTSFHTECNLIWFSYSTANHFYSCVSNEVADLSLPAPRNVLRRLNERLVLFELDRMLLRFGNDSELMFRFSPATRKLNNKSLITFTIICYFVAAYRILGTHLRRTLLQNF